MSYLHRLINCFRPITVMLALTSIILFAVANPVLAQDIAQDAAVRNNNNLGTELWKAVRQNNLPMQSQVDSGGAGPIYTDGMSWINFRKQQVMPKAAYAFGGTLLAIFLFWLIRRSVTLPEGESGKRIQRNSKYERFVHWLMAGSFIFLAISGFLLMYGRQLLIPVIGLEGYATLTAVSNTLHYWFGLVFPVAIVLMFFKFVSRNIYERGDMTWLIKGGGLINKSHPSAGFFNMGEKMLFWLVMLFGVLVSASGLIMEFQLLDLNRTEMLNTNTIHAIVAAGFVVVIFGHIYLATIGVKGTLSAMTDGTVDMNWAKAHHDRWYKQIQSVQKP